MGAFQGFPEAGLKLLRGLAEHNEKAWFDAHKDDYEALLVEPAKAFVADAGARLQKLARSIHFEPRVNGSISRPQRDIRFAKDKTPYKAHLDLWFWQGEKKTWERSGFFFRLGPDALILGAGIHHFTPELLKRYRGAVVGPKGNTLSRILRELDVAGGYEVGGRTMKKVPRGFEAGEERAELLLHTGLYVVRETPPPPKLHGPAFLDHAVAHWEAMVPIHDWLTRLGIPSPEALQ